MSTREDWNAHYAAGQMPWDKGEPDDNLVELVRQGRVTKGRVLEIGCGTGTNALWLAAQGFEVVALDVAPLAIERAKAKAAAAPQDVAKRCKLEVRDILAADLPAELQGAGFQLAFDRGCFHVFDEAKDQQTFAARIAKALAPSGLWLSLLGSTEGPAREMGPPRRSARDITAAIEPVLELISLQSMEFDGPPGAPPPKAWQCYARKRAMPAQPSTGS
jgi:SAM-dependent methyltransferase